MAREELPAAGDDEDSRLDAVRPVGSRHFNGGLAPPSPAALKGLPVITRSTFIEHLEDERKRGQACSTLPCTTVIWFLFIIILWMHGNVDSVNRLRTCVYEALNDMEVIYTPEGEVVPRMMKLETLKDTSEVWTWLSLGFVPALGGPEAGRPPAVRTFNRVVGEAMLRQRRVKETSCMVGNDLADYYGFPCYNEGGDTATEPFGIMPYAAQDSSFISGGGINNVANQDRYIAWLDTRRPRDGTSPKGLKKIADLYQAGWIDDATVSVQLHAALFNGEVGAYVHLFVEFIFQRGGLVRRKLEVKPLFAIVYSGVGLIILDILWLLLMLVIFLMALQNMADAKRSGCVHRCCGDFWLVLDWFGSIIGVGLIVFFVLFGTRLGELADRLALVPATAPPRVGDLPSNATLLQRSAAVDDLRRYHGGVAQLVEDLEWLAWVKMVHRLGMFWYVMIICARFFRGFAGQPRLATIGRTVGAAANDVLHLGFILAVVFGNFVIGGFILFGSELSAWSSFTKAMRSTFAVVFGSGNFAEMYDIMPLSATTWLFSFVLCVVFVLQNLLLAIIIDYHLEVQNECGGHEGMSLPTQLAGLAGDFWWKFSYTLRVVYRFVHARGPRAIVRRLPKIADEPWRVLRTPMDVILANLGADGYDDVDGMNPAERELPGYVPVDEGFFIRAGCDESTSARLFKKGHEFAAGRTPDTYPPGQLRSEFNYAMGKAYQRIDGFKEELTSWMYEKIVDCRNMEPRQKRLESLAEQIQPALPTPREVDQTGWDWPGQDGNLALEQGASQEGPLALEDGGGGGSGGRRKGQQEALIVSARQEERPAIWPAAAQEGELAVASTNMPRALGPPGS